MQMRKLPLLFLLCCAACKNKSTLQPEKFDKTKWATKQDRGYPHRDKMLKDLMSSYKLNGVKIDSVLNLLGPPNRIDNGHLFYLVAQSYFPNTYFPLHTKTLVIKLTKDSTVEWRKIHE